MNKIRALFCFSLLSVAAACPVKSGFVANGQVVDNIRLVPVCGTIPTELKVLPEGTSWQELFVYSVSATNSVKLLTLKAALRGKGYTQFSETKKGTSEVYQFARGNQYVVISTTNYQGARFLSVAGN